MGPETDLARALHDEAEACGRLLIRDAHFPVESPGDCCDADLLAHVLNPFQTSTCECVTCEQQNTTEDYAPP